MIVAQLIHALIFAYIQMAGFLMMHFLFLLDLGAPVLTVKDHPNRRNQRSQNTNTGQEVGHMTSTEGQGHQAGVEGQGVDTGNNDIIYPPSDRCVFELSIPLVFRQIGQSKQREHVRVLLEAEYIYESCHEQTCIC